MTPADEHTLAVHLDAPLPAAIRRRRGHRAVRRGLVLSPGRRVAALELRGRRRDAAGRRVRHAAPGRLPRAHTRRAGGRLPQRLLGHGARSRPAPRDACRPRRARAARGRRRGVAELARIPSRAADAAREVAAPPGDGPLVAICMATYDPPRELLRAPARLDPRADAPNWVCVISDDCSTPERFADDRGGGRRRRALRRVAARARRLGLLRQLRARAVAGARAAPSSSRWPTRTTRWHPDKLDDLLGAIGDAQLVYSDARIVDRDGARARRHLLGRRAQQPRRPAVAARRQRGHRRRVAAPRASCSTTRCRSRPASSPTSTTTGSALVALARGEIALRRPAALRLRPARRRRARPRRGQPRSSGCATASPRCAATRASASGCGALHYFVDVARLTQMADRARAARRRRGWPAPSAARCERFLRADRSLRALARLWARGARELRRPARDARRRVDARLRVRLAAAARARRRATRPQRAAAPGRGAAARPRPAARAPRARRRRRGAIAEKIAPLRARGPRRRARAHQPADPDDRPRAPLRRLHRQVQPRAPARRARRCACGS